MTYSPIYTSASAVYQKTGLSATELDLATNTDIIQDAETELEILTGRKFTSANAITEYLDGAKKDILGYSGTNAITTNLSFYPVQSITEFKILDIDGNATETYDTLTSVQITAGTYSTDDYWLDVMEDPITRAIICYGKISLKTDVFPVGKSNIKVAYTYGYSSVPNDVKALASCLSGIKMWVNFLGGNYNRLDSYSVPQQSVSKGDFYSRGTQMIEKLKEEAEQLLARIGRRPHRTFFATGVDR